MLYVSMGLVTLADTTYTPILQSCPNPFCTVPTNLKKCVPWWWMSHLIKQTEATVSEMRGRSALSSHEKELQPTWHVAADSWSSRLVQASLIVTAKWFGRTSIIPHGNQFVWKWQVQCRSLPPIVSSVGRWGQHCLQNTSHRSADSLWQFVVHAGGRFISSERRTTKSEAMAITCTCRSLYFLSSVPSLACGALQAHLNTHAACATQTARHNMSYICWIQFKGSCHQHSNFCASMKRTSWHHTPPTNSATTSR